MFLVSNNCFCLIANNGKCGKQQFVIGYVGISQDSKPPKHERFRCLSQKD